MKITLKQYIRNPIGKNGPMLGTIVKEAIASDYSKRFGALLLRENGRIKYVWYYDKKDNSYYCHLKIPSETVNRFYYDVVLRFYTDEKVKNGGQNLEDYYIQGFSNDPAFVFNFAHSFIINDMFIKDLEPRMSKQAVKKPAKEKNPANTTGYVKTIYFAYLFLKQHGLLNTPAITPACIPYNKKNLLKEIEPADEKVEKRQIEGAKIDRKKTITNNLRAAKVADQSHAVDKVKSVSSVKKVSHNGSDVSKVSSVKQTKRI